MYESTTVYHSCYSWKNRTVQEDRIPHFYPYLHRHKEAQLIWVIKGEGTLIADNSMHIFKPNDVFLLAPNQSHVFRSNNLDDQHAATDSVHTLSVFYDPNGDLANLFQLPELTQLNVFLKEYNG